MKRRGFLTGLIATIGAAVASRLPFIKQPSTVMVMKAAPLSECAEGVVNGLVCTEAEMADFYNMAEALHPMYVHPDIRKICREWVIAYNQDLDRAIAKHLASKEA